MNSIPTAPDQVSTVELFSRLAATIEDRRNADPEQSYVAKLIGGGTEVIAKKVGEEAIETVLAAVSEDQDAVLRESADLVFHLMVLWANRGITLGDVATELARREGVSGLEEKNGRRN